MDEFPQGILTIITYIRRVRLVTAYELQLGRQLMRNAAMTVAWLGTVEPSVPGSLSATAAAATAAIIMVVTVVTGDVCCMAPYPIAISLSCPSSTHATSSESTEIVGFRQWHLRQTHFGE